MISLKKALSWVLASSVLLFTAVCHAQIGTPGGLGSVSVQEIKTQNGSVDSFPSTIKVSNGSLVDNGDGTVSLTTGAGATSLTGLSDVGSADPTIGHILVADGTKFQSVNVPMSVRTDSNNVGIGVTAPLEKLHVKPTDTGGIFVDSESSAIGGIDGNTVLMLHYNGIDGSTAFTDSSSAAHIVSANDNAQIDTAQFKFGGASGLFDGSGDYLDSADSTDWSFGTGDFTIDLWVRFNSTAGQQVFASQYQDSTHLWAVYSQPPFLQMYFQDGTVKGSVYATPTPFVANTWYHLAFVRNGSSGIIFINGVSQSLTIDTSFSSNNVGDLSASLNIGRLNVGAFVNGWIDEERISKGLARWTSDFTPPSAEYNNGGTLTHVKFGKDGMTSWSIGNDGADVNKFKLGTTEVNVGTKLTVDGNGNVGVGYTKPQGLLTVNGNVGIGNSVPAFDLDIVSNATANNTVSAVSNSLTLGSVANFTSSSTSTATRALVQITNSASGAVGASGLKVTQNSSAPAIIAPTMVGGTSAGDNLTFNSTSNPTKGNIILGSSSGMLFEESTGHVTFGGPDTTIGLNGTTFGMSLAVHDDGLTDLAEDVIHRHSNTPSIGANMILAKSRGTEASETAVQNGDAIGYIGAWGHNGTDYTKAAQIGFFVDATPGAADMPGRINFSTTPDGSTTLAERMRIDNTGNVGIGTTSPAQPLQVNGIVYSSFGGIKYPNGDVVAAGSLTGLTDVGSNGHTAANILVADGSKFQSVGVSGDITMTSAGVTSIGTNKVGPTQIASTAVTAGTYSSTALTVDQDGRIINAASGSLTGLTDVTTATKTNGNLLIADGTNFKSTAMIGDATINSAGTLTVGSGTITSSKLANTSVTAGSYSSTALTVNAQGQIINAASGSLTGLTDIGTATKTAGNLLVADGTKFQSVSMDGDVSMTSAGSVTISKINNISISGDPLNQYAILNGRSGGQTLKGGTGNAENLILQSTNSSTRGSIQLVDSAYLVTGALTNTDIYGLNFNPSLAYTAADTIRPIYIAPSFTYNAGATLDYSTIEDASVHTFVESGVLSTFSLMKANATLQGATTSKPLASTTVLNNTMTLQATANNIGNTSFYRGVNDNSTFQTTAAGATATMTSMDSFRSAPIIAATNATASTTVTTRRGLSIQAITGSTTGTRTVTNNVGVDIAAQTVGTNIYGIRSAIAAASGRYFLHDTGGAQSDFSGNVGIGYSVPGASFVVNGNVGIGTSAPATNLSIIGHVHYGGTSATVTACGTSPSITGNDNVGTVTTGSTATTSCQVNFGVIWGASNGPYCFVNPRAAGVTPRVSSVSTSSFTMTYASGTSLVLDYWCAAIE